MKNVPLIEKFLFVVLVIATLSLRFMDLSYADYISDEPGTFFYRGGKKNPEMTKTQFILSQRKGPIQLFVGYIPYSIIGNYKNELAQRLPFAIFSSASIVVFYFLVKRLSSNFYIAFMGAFLLSVNGLIVAYGRIAQYQNLNLFFSFSALYFYSFLMDRPTGRHPVGLQSLALKSVLGTVMFSLSLLSHWDAVYVLIPTSYFFISFLLNKSCDWRYKIKLIPINFIVGFAILLPFLFPYFQTYIKLAANSDYAEGIIGYADSFVNRDDLKQFLIYNPFLTLCVYAAAAFVGIFLSNDRPVFSVWFLSTLLIFRFFVKYSGLHFYNIFIPLVVLAGYAMYRFVKKLPFLWLRVSAGALLSAVFLFLYLQSYILFVDHKVEYPVEEEKILFWKTRRLEQADNIRHKTGFTHKRYWGQINTFVNGQNTLNGENCGYVTNEDKVLAKFYMDAPANEIGNCFYAIGVKRPLSLAYDYSLPHIKNKHTVKTFENEFDETVVRIYKVDVNSD